jgi:hypothetical protein
LLSTIQGTGALSNATGNGWTLNNNATGVINANVNTGTLQISNLTVNNAAGGVLKATGGGILDLNSSGIANSGTISADGAGSAVLIDSSSITGGTLATTNSGVIQTVTGTSSTLADP